MREDRAERLLFSGPLEAQGLKGSRVQALHTLWEGRAAGAKGGVRLSGGEGDRG